MFSQNSSFFNLVKTQVHLHNMLQPIPLCWGSIYNSKKIADYKISKVKGGLHTFQFFSKRQIGNVRQIVLVPTPETKNSP